MKPTAPAECPRHHGSAAAAGWCGVGAAIAAFFFLFYYWWRPGTQALGTSLAIFFAALAAALVFAAQAVKKYEEVSARREPHASPPAEREGVAAAWRDNGLVPERRGLLRGLAITGVGAASLMGLSFLRALFPWTNPYRILDSTVWQRGQRLITADGKPIRADALPPGGTAIVFPEGQVGSERAQTALIRVAPHLLREPADRATWAPMGNIAYSRVCTHAGCPVGLYLKTAHTLMCPCHQSTFDVLKGARPTGGPADRPLPQLPLYVDAEGFLRAAGGFSQPPGPGFWSFPA
jgi:ubiquinol-cytochrome c reductase iron-sulfur subunit